VGAVTGLTFDQQTARKDIRNLFFQIVTETIQVGKADGVRFEKLNGTISPISLSNLSSWPPSFIKHLIMKKIGEKYKGAESSMLQSIRRGRQPEIESINGVISSVGRKHNVPTPVHDKLIELVLEIAAGKREPAIENLKEAGLLKV
jgi:2-dehydropantoate 2-reductase